MAVLENFQSAAVRHGRKYQQRIHDFFTLKMSWSYDDQIYTGTQSKTRLKAALGEEFLMLE